ncbi:reverse transcriptase domain-containing protein [Lachnospiraceae bacterium 46-61]
MKPTMEILTKLRKNSKEHKDEVFTKLFRYLLRPDIYFIAYQHLYVNKGVNTKGINDDTADGFSEESINKIIKSLKNETYQPKPVRRIYIKKPNGKMRPLGLPTFTDKIVQEVIRMILEAIYEPIFSEYSHGFRQGRSCHTALAQLKHEFIGTSWFVEGDIKGCFDNINHNVLIKIINKKIKDARMVKLIQKFLKAGYIEDWNYHNTYSGCPQGGILSPILANIYLNELDQYIEKIKNSFNKRTLYKTTPEYTAIQQKRRNISRKINRREQGEERSLLIEEYKNLTKKMYQIPAKLCDDKKIKYIRYADDFLIAINGNRKDCEWIKSQLTDFIYKDLKMELSQEKTLITHSSNYARFLGYDVRVRHNQQVKRWKNTKQRTMNHTVELLIPYHDKIEKFLFQKGVVTQRKDTGKMEPCKRNSLIGITDLEIVDTYNAELRGICNYYSLASNYRNLNYFSYLMEYSCLKTLAAKHRTKISKIRDKYHIGAKKWGVPYETKVGIKRRQLTKFNEITSKKCEDVIPKETWIHGYTMTTLEDRLKTRKCELCGNTNSGRYEIHHVNKVKNLKGKKHWERIMIAKKRKTMVVCHECHQKIHHGF